MALQGFHTNKSVENVSTPRTLIHQSGNFYIYAQRTGDTVTLWGTGRGLAAGDITITLPEQFRPSSGLELPIFQRSTSNADISPAGQLSTVYNGMTTIRIMSGVTTSTWLMFNGSYAGRDL